MTDRQDTFVRLEEGRGSTSARQAVLRRQPNKLGPAFQIQSLFQVVRHSPWISGDCFQTPKIM
jgi:hypothetical protein